MIVLNWNGRHHLDACLTSLLALDYPSDRLQVILCDNGSTDGSVDYLREHFPVVEVVRLDINQGFAGGNNFAVKHASGEWIGFLNNDMRVPESWLKHMLKPLSDQPSLACISSRILDWDGSTIDFVGGTVSFQGHGVQLEHGASSSGHDRARRILFPCGGAMLIRKDLFEEVDGFDDSYFAYYEDVDLGWRLNLLGHDVWYNPEATVNHRHHGTAGSAIPPEKLLALAERNALFTIFKNFDDDNLAAALPVAMILLNEKALGMAGPDRADFTVTPAAELPAPPAVPQAREPALSRALVLGREKGLGALFDKALARVGRRFRASWGGLLLGLARRSSVGGLHLVPGTALGYLVALSEFGHNLDQLLVKRAWVQAHRVRSDAELFSDFPMAMRDPSTQEPRYLAFQQWLSGVMQLEDRFGGRSR